jgi:hypothetical protein
MFEVPFNTKNIVKYKDRIFAVRILTEEELEKTYGWGVGCEDSAFDHNQVIHVTDVQIELEEAEILSHKKPVKLHVGHIYINKDDAPKWEHDYMSSLARESDDEGSSFNSIAVLQILDDDDAIKREEEIYDAQEMERTEIDESMDGDHESALASAGWGTDEDYGGDIERL